MYNDHYLQQIDNKINTTNNNLLDILENQETIIQNQQTIISGDNIREQIQSRIEINTGIAVLILAILLIYNFIVRCLK